MAKNDDTRKARQRFVDQPGQRIDTTPKAVKQRQAKAWKEIARMLNKPEDSKKK